MRRRQMYAVPGKPQEGPQPEQTKNERPIIHVPAKRGRPPKVKPE